MINTCKICSAEANHPSWQARDMRQETPERFPYFQCNDCGCLQIEKIPVNLSDYYPETYDSFKKISQEKLSDYPWKKFLRGKTLLSGISERWYAKLLRYFFSFPSHHEWFRLGNISINSIILDVGCGNGSLLLRMWKEGFQNITGVDPFIPEDIHYKKGLTIKKTAMEYLENDSYYDFIMLNHSLEHMPDQFAAFRHINRLLKVKGKALIRIPVANSFAWEWYRTNWVRLESPRHLFLHTEKSMSILSERCNFDIREVVYDSGESQFYRSELCKMGVLIQDQTNHIKTYGKKLFSESQFHQWNKKSKELNMNKKGDIACFYLYKP